MREYYLLLQSIYYFKAQADWRESQKQAAMAKKEKVPKCCYTYYFHNFIMIPNLDLKGESREKIFFN